MTRPPRRGRPPKAEGRNTRDRILDEALEGFARHGYAGTSIRRIAQAVGIRESGIYSHFESKQAIFDALFAEAGPTVVLNVLETGVDAAAGPATVVRQLVEGVVAVWDEPRARMFTSVLLREGGSASTAAAIDPLAMIGQVQRGLGEVFGEWAKAGLIRDDFPPEHLVWELMAPIAMIRLLHLHASATEDTRAAGRRLARAHVEYFLECAHAAGAPGGRE